MRKMFLPLAAAFCFSCMSNIFNCQYNPVLGDLSIESHRSDVNLTGTFDAALLELDDSFSP